MSFYFDSIDKFEYLARFCKVGISDIELKGDILSAIYDRDFLKVSYLFNSLSQSDKTRFESSFNRKNHTYSKNDYILSPDITTLFNEFLDIYQSSLFEYGIEGYSASEKIIFCLRKEINSKKINELCSYLNSKLIDIYKTIKNLEAYSYKLVNDSILVSEAIHIISSDVSIDGLHQEHYDVINNLFRNDLAEGDFSYYDRLKIQDVYKTYIQLKE